MMRIGLTGGMGSGKTTVSRWMKARGISVIDVDALTREVHGRAEICAQLRAAFGDGIFEGDSGAMILSRKRLGEIAFCCEENRERLNAIMHPALKRAAMEALSTPRPVVLDAPLLFEAGWETLVDVVVVVMSAESARLERIAARDGLTREQIRARFAGQITDEERRRRADFLVYNVGDLSMLSRQVDHILNGLMPR